MAKVIKFPEPEQHYPMYYVCGHCDSQAFLLRDDGKIECNKCDQIPENIDVTLTIT